MKKGFLFGILIAFFFCFGNAYADSCDVLDLFDNTYVGVGAVDMQKLPDREIYGKLMSFFMTDPDAKRILMELEQAGMTSKSVRRIVIGIPNDVERAEFLMVWETMTPIVPYLPIIEKHANSLDKTALSGQDYYCKKNSNQCLMILDDFSVVLGSRAKIVNFITLLVDPDKREANGRLKQMSASLVEKDDAWLVFWLDDVQRARIGQGDPIVDMRSEGKGTLRLGSIQSGKMSIDFSKGLKANIAIQMDNADNANSFANIMTTLLDIARKDDDVKSLGLIDVINGIQVNAQTNEFLVTVVFSHETFIQLIGVITDLVKMTARDGLENTTAKKIQS